MTCHYTNGLNRVQSKSVLQPAIRASCSQHVLAHKSFQLAPKLFLISRIDYNPSVTGICPKNSTCLSSKLRTKITSPIAKSTCPGLFDTTFFACWFKANTRQSSDFCIFCSLHDVHHFAEKPVEVLQNCGCFLSLPKRHRFSNDSEFVYHKNIFFFEQLNFKILAQFLVCWNKGLSAYLGQISYHDNSYAMLAVNPLNTKSDQHQFSPNNRLQELIK